MTLYVKNKSFGIKTLGTVFLLFASISTISIALSQTTDATSGWDAGNIISDAVLTNYNSMSVNHIQSFLNSKVPTCDTNGTQSTSYYYNPSTKYVSFYTNKSGASYVTTSRAIYGQRWDAYTGRTDGDAPFVCLKNYKENGLSSAQIIYNVAHQYQINPQALIVLLQKEQGLVTDTWPQGIQYQSATGYGCPDDSACKTKYYGFTNQLSNAASDWHLAETPGSSYSSGFILNASNYIQYNPDTSCGGSNVYIQNRATWAFYTYTPYQPNSATLKAPMGTEVTCGAYGNLDFYLDFTSWFGSTYVPLVFKTTSSDQAYLLNGDKYYHINSTSMLSAYGFSKSDIGVVTPNMLSLYTDGGTLKNITRIDGGSEIYLVDHGKFLQFPSSELYNTYGYTITGNEQDLDPLILDNVSKGPTLTDVVRAGGQSELYLMSNGKKSHISSPTAYTTMGSPIYSSRTTTALSQTYIDSISFGAPIITPGSFVKNTSDNKVFFWNGTDLQLIDNRTLTDAAIAIDYAAPTIEQLTASTRSTINQLVKDVDGKLYIINGHQKLEIQPSELTNLGFIDSDFAVLPAGFLDKLAVATVQFSDAFRINSDSKVYVVKSGQRYYVTSADALGEQGFTFSQVANLNARSASLFSDSGKNILPQGQLFRIGATDSVYIVSSSNTCLHVPSLRFINSYGLSLKNTQNYTAQQVSDYANSGNLRYFAKDISGNVWQIDNGGQKRPVSTDVSGSLVFNLNVSGLPILSDILLSKFTTQPALTNLIKVSSQDQVYKVENGARRWVISRTVFNSMGLLSSDIRIVSDNFKNSLPTGLPIK
jgi:hypothetical protein